MQMSFTPAGMTTAPPPQYLARNDGRHPFDFSPPSPTLTLSGPDFVIRQHWPLPGTFSLRAKLTREADPQSLTHYSLSLLYFSFITPRQQDAHPRYQRRWPSVAAFLSICALAHPRIASRRPHRQRLPPTHAAQLDWQSPHDWPDPQARLLPTSSDLLVLVFDFPPRRPRSRRRLPRPRQHARAPFALQLRRRMGSRRRHPGLVRANRHLSLLRL